MTEQAGGDGGSFDLDRLKTLFELMEEYDVAEVNLREGDTQWRLRRGAEAVAYTPPPVPASPVPQPASQPAPPAQQAVSSSETPAAEGTVIRSPTVGTFYTSPSPDDPVFVKVGDQVTPDTVVCLVEAMKVFNQVSAEVSGTIKEILAENGDAVEFGQPLFLVDPA